MFLRKNFITLSILSTFFLPAAWGMNNDKTLGNEIKKCGKAFLLAAKMNRNPSAMHEIGVGHQNGFFPVNENRSKYWLNINNETNEENFVEACVITEKNLKKYNIPDELLPTVLYDAGCWYQHGVADVLEENPTKSARYFSESANRGYVCGQFKMGCFCFVGKGGIKKDEEKAVEWFSKAAKNKSESRAADYVRAVCYAQGKGVKKNKKEANKLCRSSCCKGYARAQEVIKKARGSDVRVNEELGSVNLEFLLNELFKENGTE